MHAGIGQHARLTGMVAEDDKGQAKNLRTGRLVGTDVPGQGNGVPEINEHGRLLRLAVSGSL
jgi:hypothetical protein